MPKPTILLLSHGRMAEGIVTAIRMFTCKTEQMSALCLTENLDAKGFRQQVSNHLDELKEAKQLLVFADLPGGSPFTIVLEVLQEKGLLARSFVIAGMNLPVVLGAIMHEELYQQSEIEQLIEEARSSIQLFEICNDEETL